MEKRRAIVIGEAEAPENETEEGKKALEEAGDVPPGIPDFWVTALSNHPELEERITDKDREVLSYLTDIRSENLVDADTGEDTGFELTFSFKENPFLTDSQLTVQFHMTEDHGYLQVRDITGCDVHWRPDKDVTVKKMRKKPKPGAKNKGPQTKLEPVDSFFRWFTDAPEVPENFGEEEEDEEEDVDLDEVRDAVEAHLRIGEVLHEDIIPNAVKWFTGEALLEMQEEEDDEDDDEEEFDSEDEDDEGEEGEGDDDDDDEDDSGDEQGPGGPMPKDAKETPAECKQQ